MKKVDPSSIFSHHPFTEEIFHRLTNDGYRAVLVGGAVRDLLREYLDPGYQFDPAKVDIDIATDAPVGKIRSLFTDQRIVEVGAQFGVLLIIGPNGKEYEIAQFRTERNYDGRKPGEVSLTDTLREDVRRRDFTINGLAMEESGEIIDHVEGMEDLKNKTIRAIGEAGQRFREDYLRPLRAIRFTALLDGEIEEDTWKAINEVAEEITSIAWERIREEFVKLLQTSRSARGVELMRNCGLLRHVLPELTANIDVSQPEEYHPEGDVFEHSLKALEVADELDYSPLVKMAVLLHDVGKKSAYRRSEGMHMGGHENIAAELIEDIGERLRLSNRETQFVRWLVENHMRVASLPQMNKAKQVKLIQYRHNTSYSVDQVRCRFSHFSALFQVLIADSQASAHQSGGWLPALKQFVKVLPHVHDLDRLAGAREIINGNDLLELGLQEGPLLGEILEELHHRIYGGQITSREQALQQARDLIKESKSESDK